MKKLFGNYSINDIVIMYNLINDEGNTIKLFIIDDNNAGMIEEGKLYTIPKNDLLDEIELYIHEVGLVSYGG